MNVTPTINTKRLFKRTSRVKKIRKSFARYGVVSVNTILVMAMIGFLGYGKLKHDPQVAQTNNAVTATEQVAVLDEISSADIAANIAIAAKLPEADQVRNQADSRNALATIAVSNDTVVAKPQIITNETASSQSRSDIIEYTAQSGDTISSLAARYNVSSDSIRWSNGLSGDTIAVGNKVVIPPKNRNGIVYKVGVSDDIGKLAEKYKTTKEKIIAFNDLELTNALPVNEYIFLPEAEKPADPVPVVAVASTARGTSTLIATPIFSGSNGYSFGYCTWWVAQRRAQASSPIPSNWGNANTWDEYASAQGWSVSKVPVAGSILQDDGGQYYSIYHVAYVEAVYPDGSILVSEMNVRGWNVASQQRIPASRLGVLDFIY